jgi:phage terminase large subunit GpA-like protein
MEFPRAPKNANISIVTAMTRVADVRARALRSLIPPPRLRLAAWIEREIVLPEDVSALPGHVRLWPYQREIADAISDPLIERVTLVKGVRLGFTTLLTGAIGAYVANEPAANIANCAVLRSHVTTSRPRAARLYWIQG